ncbi:phosphotransferase [Agrococcus sp. SL85]|uniref:phosphotransferase n=1 Tax=Agrococcus sp. SL85 TaxID=2995141 RepID=UPI00226CBF93|nr:phosphotransferase [Agrococcus sp. SL85]WAC65673.1 phosphotransferase [Agrococcus sp. SL85]
MIEEELSGGNASGRVVRVGTTVRKARPSSWEAVAALLAELRSRGVPAPEPIGVDDQGRAVLEFVPGALAMDVMPLGRADLARVGRLVRAIHDASVGWRPPVGAAWDPVIAAPGAELVCHNDLGPWNLVLGDRWTFIDWDGAAPSTRLWDLAYAAQAFALSDPAREPVEAAADLAALVDGYGADGDLRRDLPEALGARAGAMLELLRSSRRTGREPWATMHDAGHGAHWAAVTAYAVQHRDAWAAALLPPDLGAAGPRPRAR